MIHIYRGAPMYIGMARNIQGDGRMISRMAKERKCGQISQFTKVNIRWARNMGKENLFGMMGTIILDNLKII